MSGGNRLLKNKIFWQILAGILTVSVPIAFWYFWQRESKSINISIESNVQVVSLGVNKIDGVDLFYKNKKIDSLSVIEIRVTNDGNSPVKKDDFSKSLRFVFDGEIISESTVLESSPSQLEPRAIVEKENVSELEPLLMNPGDSFLIRYNVSNSKGGVAVQGRVVGVKQLVVSTVKPTTGFNYKLLAIVETAFLGFIVVFIFGLAIIDSFVEERRKRFLRYALEDGFDFNKAMRYARTYDEHDKVCEIYNKTAR